MPIEVNEKKEDTTKYPWLGENKSKATIVLFFGPSKGICLKGGDCKFADKVGDYSIWWDMNDFKPFKGSITIYNT